MLLDLSLLVAVATNGLLAGLFFTFVWAICPALRGHNDGSYVETFRAINAAIVNRWFLSVFFVAPAASVVAVGLAIAHGGWVSVLVVALATAFSVATFIITAARNVPLNRALDHAVVRSEVQASEARDRFEAPWNRWNILRSFSSCGALVFFVVATLLA